MHMIETFRKFLKDLGGAVETAAPKEEDLRLAAAALLFHTMAIDGDISVGERELLRDLLAERFDLSAAQTHALIADAGEADAEAVDLYGFTSVLKRNMEIGDRENIIGMMWHLVYADGHVHEFEDNVVWRAAELLGVSRGSRLRLKQLARADAD
jgi:uncharacterized tellurite resistance protein B-like protein